MNENSSKQVLLSILGIAVLVVAVVGVSFAFFSYSKTGTAENVITTGSITFSFAGPANNVTLTDQFPQSEVGDNATTMFNFSVNATLPATADPAYYTVTALKGSDETGKTRLADSEVNVYVTTTGGNVLGQYDTEDVGHEAGNSTQGFLIGKGTFAAGSNNVTHSYGMTMFVNDTVTISDTNSSATYCASAQDTEVGTGCATGKDVYTTKFYSLKVKVDTVTATAYAGY